MKHRLATAKDIKKLWVDIEAVLGPVVATAAILFVIFTYPISGWVPKKSYETNS